MILPMYIFGQPVLRKVADDVEEDFPNLKELIENMYETLRRSEGVGLAAPQVGVAKRLFIVDLDCLSEDHPEYKGYLKTFINPEIVEFSKETSSYEEGCLSLPGIHENVKRPTRVLVNYLDENFEEHEEWFEEFPARVIQHEYDHLDGKMFIDHLSAFRKQLLKSKLVAMTKGKFEVAYKCKPNR
ncbi:MAG: peptide deformylase [Bacteroidaceae bacterium]|nr:peptide deformylase [Bacteroidaceae bacterium]